jgi:PilZ domain-containing protein
MEPEDDSEHRRAQRFRVFKVGTIEFSGNAIPCTVRNLSASGAALEINSPLWFPDSFTLGIASDGLHRACHVVWRREKRIGVAFDRA